MNRTLERYATGIGLVLGAGVGGTAALVAGLSTEFAVVSAFGASGGLVVGGFVGRYAATTPGEENRALRLLAFALLVGLAAGALLGALTAWMVDASLVPGVVTGGGAGGVFGLLLSGVLLSKGGTRTRRRTTV